MYVFIRNICLLSVAFGLVSMHITEKRIKSIASLAFACAVVYMFITAYKSFDFSSYSLQLSKYRDYETQLTQSSETLSDTLNRTVIEEQCCAYIMDEAAVFNCNVWDVKVTVNWADGVWYPVGCRLKSNSDELTVKKLSSWIAINMGIGEEAQIWEK